MQGLPKYALKFSQLFLKLVMATCYCARPFCSLPISDSIQTVLCMEPAKTSPRLQQFSLHNALSEPSSECESQSFFPLSLCCVFLWLTLYILPHKYVFFSLPLPPPFYKSSPKGISPPLISRNSGRERGGRERPTSLVSHTHPYWGWGICNKGTCSWLGIKSATLQYAGQCSNHQDKPARAHFSS